MRRAAVLGKGMLAAHACDVIAGMPGWQLDVVVPTAVEPAWDLSLSHHVATRHPATRLVGSGDWRELVVAGPFDLVLSVLYDRIFGPELIRASGRILNLHPGRLPEYRGVRPVNWALRDGADRHGVTLHEVDAGIDSGPIVAEASFTIWPEVDEVRDVWLRSMAYARQLLSDTLPRLDTIRAVPQDESRARIHYSAQNHGLGDRLSWTGAESTTMIGVGP